ncbi:MAG: undecaprenyl/decaprenyl-phosphate alpha-N-acetylglucosaminyl 1-phosphate transferase [Oscillospiraceae bacterium]|nr:undecaprenyl/decaprenyl-phosphate alpha-N-acetylglucosaminyl 1-phosphate transferase [Oscillospiraceae bacterium]
MILDTNFLLRVGAALLVAGLISFVLTPFVKHLATWVGAVDVPKDNRRMHKVPIPRMGGLAIFIGFLLSSLIFCPEMDREIQSILLGAVLIVVLGVFDDKYTLGAKLKLVIQILAASIVVFYGDLRIARLTNPFGDSLYSYWDFGLLSYPITIIWIVAITNAVNFIDGLDGLACGVSCISSVNLLVIALMVSDGKVAIIMAALAGACLGFVPFNFNPAKIFMGDTGSTFLGFMLATVSIQGLFKAYTVISFIVPFLLLGLPIFDICFAIIRRVASGRSPMEADRGHFHHRLIDMGFSQKQSVAIAYVLTGILGLAAVLLTVSGAMRTLILLGSFLVVGAIGMSIIMNGMPRANFWHHVKHGTMPHNPNSNNHPAAPGSSTGVDRKGDQLHDCGALVSTSAEKEKPHE